MPRIRIPFALAIFLFIGVPFPGLAEWPGAEWSRRSPEGMGLDVEKLHEARDYALTGQGSGIVIYQGVHVLSWGDQTRQYDLKSTTKSFGATALGVAIRDRKVALEDLASKHHPFFQQNTEQAPWNKMVTLFHLASQTAAFEKRGGSTNQLFAPGTKWDYSDSGPNYLAECLTLVYQEDMSEFMFKRVFSPIGIQRSDLRWRKNQYRARKINNVERREFGSGIHANVDAMARLGYLYLKNGRWKNEQIIDKAFIKIASQPLPSVLGIPEHNAKQYGNASDHYGLLWWNNADKTIPHVPADAYWSWGLYDSLILVVPSKDLVVARAGKSWKRQWEGHYSPLIPFFQPLCDSVPKQAEKTSSAIQRIKTIEWSAPSTILRKAKGSDNWPITWADDNHMYTAYGDGWGFEPKVEKKLSLGFARIEGGPSDFRGINIRSETGEFLGDGAKGPKASGLIMVEGVLYIWIRNVANSQLGWSADKGATWQWADWKFKRGFAAPTFLNSGRNNANARDDFVYLYSFDSNSAYEAANRMVLARVPKTQIRSRDAYQFFVKRRPHGMAEWSKEAEACGAVFSDRQGCYRSHVSYNRGINRFLWVQIKGTDDTRFRGGLAIYESSYPWGPWQEVYHATKWDVGPGESASFPTKWMSPDGKNVHLVFSGDDFFSVRKARLILHGQD